MSIYGYVNGKAVFSNEEFIYAQRHFGAIKSDEELIAYAKKVTGNWSQAGHCRTFITFYLEDYCLSEPCRSLTKKEFMRLKELQEKAEKEYKEREKAKEWKKVDTMYYADNSIEEIYENKYGERKTIMVTAPHGDIC